MNDLKFTTALDYMNFFTKKPFRNWFTKIWEEHKLEKEHLGEKINYTASEYFCKNKKFLVNLYKEEHRNAR